jgi:hypothetical protein
VARPRPTDAAPTGWLAVARLDEPAQHRGAVLPVHASVFAPPPTAVAAHRAGRLTATGFRVAYVAHLRALWHRDPQAFRAVLDQAAAGGADGPALTLVDDWGDAPYAPRHMLAAALKQVAAARRSGAPTRAARGAPPPAARADG